MKQESTAKQRIFDNAVRLFAHKGYDATGVREIAGQARVNLAMINYFYGSKHKLLEAIIVEFFQGVQKIMLENVLGDDPPEVKLERNIKAIARHVVQNPDQALVAVRQLPTDDPEATETRVEWFNLLRESMLKNVIEEMGRKWGHALPFHILAPAIIAAVTSHFMFKPVLEKLKLWSFDDDFYQCYPEIITQVALKGLFSLAENRPPERIGHESDRSNRGSE